MTFKTLFVTCGATVPFPQLLETVFSPTLARTLHQFKFNRIIVQFGRGYRDSFIQLINPNNAPVKLKSDSRISEELVSGDFDGIEIIGFEYSTKIQDIIRENADLVISHAGTGSILDSLRLNKRLIVCVNDKLMDNHQQEIADQFASSNYLWACFPEIDEMIECIRGSETGEPALFPSAYNKCFEKALSDLVYGNFEE